jgi:hypothetical protein
VHRTFPLILILAILQFGVLNHQGVAGTLFGVIVTLLLFIIVVLHELIQTGMTRIYDHLNSTT